MTAKQLYNNQLGKNENFPACTTELYHKELPTLGFVSGILGGDFSLPGNGVVMMSS